MSDFPAPNSSIKKLRKIILLTRGVDYRLCNILLNANL